MIPFIFFADKFLIDQHNGCVNMTGISACRLLDLPKVADTRGNLTFIENGKHIPFTIKRIYYLYDVPAGESRGGHAHRTLEQVIIPASGSFDVGLDDGYSQKTVPLNRPFLGLYIPPMIWRTLNNFSAGSVCIVLASDFYYDKDYIRDIDFFRNLVREHPQSEELTPTKRKEHDEKNG
jgi:hypothetical protein